MNRQLRMGLVAGLALAGLGMVAKTASALPASGINPAAAQTSAAPKDVQPVRYICGYWGCRWIPGPYWAGGYYPYWGGYYPYWRRYPYWHRWHHWRRW
ncbi:MAG: hypothetical protein ACYC5H_11610 [Methylovirgula sp.]